MLRVTACFALRLIPFAALRSAFGRAVVDAARCVLTWWFSPAQPAKTTTLIGSAKLPQVMTEPNTPRVSRSTYTTYAGVRIPLRFSPRQRNIHD